MQGATVAPEHLILDPSSLRCGVQLLLEPRASVSLSSPPQSHASHFCNAQPCQVIHCYIISPSNKKTNILSGKYAAVPPCVSAMRSQCMWLLGNVSTLRCTAKWPYTDTHRFSTSLPGW